MVKLDTTSHKLVWERNQGHTVKRAQAYNKKRKALLTMRLVGSQWSESIRVG